MYCVICGKHRKFKNPKIYIFEKALGLLLFTVSVKMKMKKYQRRRIN